MPKPKPATAHKLKFRPTPIARLSVYDEPLCLMGNPDGAHNLDWESYQRVVYAAMMKEKRKRKRKRKEKK